MLISGLLIGTAAAAQYVVSQDHEGGWHMQHSSCDGGAPGTQEFAVGPQGAPGSEQDGDVTPGDSPSGAPPAGVGSLKMTTPRGPELEDFRNTSYAGVLLTSITNLTYWTYVGEDVFDDPLSAYTPAIYIDLHFNNDGDPEADDTLSFEPAYQDGDGGEGENQHSVTKGTWQKWIAKDTGTERPEGNWILASQYQEAVRDPVNNPLQYKSLEAWADSPRVGRNASIVNPGGLGGVVLGAGCGSPGPWEGFTGYTDDFRITVSGTQDTYDFDPSSPADERYLDCEPERDANPTGSNHTITCTATRPGDLPAQNANIDVEMTGANDTDGDTKSSPDFTCTTNSEGVCQFSHGPQGAPPRPTNTAGETKYTAWVDLDNNDKTSEADDDEGQFGSPDDQPSPRPTPSPSNSPGDNDEPDNTDVVTKTWVARTASGGGVDAEPEEDTNELGESHTITATVYDQFGDPLIGNTTVKFEFFAGSPSDTDGTTSPGTPDKTCTTSNSSSCPMTYTQASTPGVDRVCVWTNEDPAMTGNSQNGTCAGEGTSDPDDSAGTTDPQNDGDSQAEPGDDVDVVTKIWVQGSATRLECDPESAVTPSGSAHRITCTARTTGNLTTSGVNIDAEITGVNDTDNGDSRTSPDLTCTTGSNGTCVLTHGPGGVGNSSQQGLTTYRAWIDRDGDASSEADATEGRDENQVPGARSEPDNTDVVETRWENSPLECEPETSSGPLGVSHRIMCSAPPGSQIDVEASGVNDPDGAESNTTPDFTCTTGSSGNCEVSHSTTTTGTVGTTTYRAWIDAPGSDSTVEADATEGQNETTTPGAVAERDTTDVVTRTWTAEATVACNDGEDNDGDARIDHPADPGCTSPTDDSEEDPVDPDPGFPPQDFGGEIGQSVDRGPCRGFTTGSVQQNPNGDGLVVVGTGGPDALQGGGSGDLICALGGDDTVNGVGGEDSIYGGGDQDLLVGGDGDDIMSGGAGSDTLRGQADSDTLRGRAGNDKVSGGGANDDLFGGPGRDVLRGRSGNDLLLGGAGQDILHGGEGRDTCRPGRGRDTMRRCE